MARRIHLTQLEIVRQKIRTSQLINRLQNHALGKLKKPLSVSQQRAIEALLRKTLPDLSSVELKGDPERPVGVRWIKGDDERK